MKLGLSFIRHASRPTQRGFALLTGLIMLVLISLISLAAARGIRQETVMANNTRERDLAFQAAEAALADAESKLLPVYHQYVTASPSKDCSVAGLIYRLDPDSDGCPVGSNGNGCPAINTTNTITACQIKSTTAKYWTDAAPNGYGWFDSNGAIDTSKSIATSQTIAGVDLQARYVVEFLGTVAAPVANPPCSTTAYRYRFTALAVGASTATSKIADTRVMLQSEVMLCPA